jgi:hypothetical protein
LKSSFGHGDGLKQFLKKKVLETFLIFCLHPKKNCLI